MLKVLSKFGTLFFMLTATLFFYQNCGESFKGGTGLLSSSSKSDDDDKGKKDKPPGVPTIADWDDPFPAGKDDHNCMDSDEYNICLIYKNPVFVKGASFSPKLTPSTSNDTIEAQIMTYGLKVPDAGPLENRHFRSTSSNKADAADNGGSWKFPYEGDTNHYVAQMAVFYWSNRLVTYMEEVTGKFYYANKGAPYTAYDAGTENNAFFDGSGTTYGYSTLGGSGQADVGLDAGVVAHEAGHGNLFEASRGAGISRSCPNKNGCFGGIHEGQGDVHTFILFPEKSTLGEYFGNTANGLRSPASIKDQGLTAQDLFRRRNGQVHDMGEVYASLWWEVWEKAKNQGRKEELETIFTEHLAGLGASDNFTTALEVIRTIADSTAAGNASVIKQDFDIEYNRMGVDLP